MNDKIKNMIKKTHSEIEKIEKMQNKQNDRITEYINDSTYKAYCYIWSIILSMYKEDIKRCQLKDDYVISIENIGTKGLIEGCSHKKIKINPTEIIRTLNYLNCNPEKSNEISIIVIQDRIYIINLSIFKSLAKDGIKEVCQNYYSISRTTIEASLKQEPKKQKLKLLVLPKIRQNKKD